MGIFQNLQDTQETNEAIEQESLVQQKIKQLEQATADKLAKLQTGIKQGANLEDSYSINSLGYIDQNKNKIWNDESDIGVQDLLSEAANQQLRKGDDGKYYFNSTGEEYTGELGRAYMYGTKDDSGVKFGIARGDLPSSDYRYEPGRAEAEGYSVGKNGYGWEPGDSGVDVNKNYMDMLLPYNVSKTLEGAVHGRTGAIENRRSPNSMIDKYEETSGQSEYYTSPEGLLGDTSQLTNEEIEAGMNENRLDKYLGIAGDKQYSNFGGKKLNEQQIDELINGPKSETGGIVDRGINIAKAPVAMALNWALDTGDFLTGLANEDYANAIFGDAKSRTDAVNKALGYDSKYSEENISKIKDIAVKNMSEQIAESDKGWFDKKLESYDGVGSEFAKRINNLVSNVDSKEALDILKLGLTNPETAVEFFGVIALEALGSKGAGMLTKAGKVQKNIDNVNDAVKTGKLTPESGALKIEQIKDANGISKMNELTYNVAKNSPLVALSYGQANRQDEEFYENTGRHMTADELTGAAMMNMLSFKLEKFADMSIVKGIPDVSSVVDKTLSKLPQNVASKIAGGLLGTATKLSAGAAGEAGQESVQSLIETLNTYNLTGEDAKALTKEQEAKIAEEVAVGTLAAPGSSILMQTPMTAAGLVSGSSSKIGEKFGGLKDSAVNKAKEMKSKTSDIMMDNPNKIVENETAEAAKVNVANYNTKLDNIAARIAAGNIDDSEINSMLDDITEASIYASKSGNIDEGTQDILYGKVIANNRALKEIMASRRDDVLKNGNTSRMQSLASDPKNKEKFKKMLDITDEEGNPTFGEIDFNDEVIAKNYMKAGTDAGLDEETLNDIKDEYVAVSTIRKSIGDVSKEVSSGARGYLTYKKNIEDAINEENLDKIDENLNKMDKFVELQQNKLSVLDKAIAEVETEVASTGKNSGSKEYKYPSGQKFEINYKNVYENMNNEVKSGGIYSIRNNVADESGAMAKVAELTAKEVSKRIEGFKKSSEDIASLTNEYKNLVAKERKNGLNKSDKKRLEFLGKKIKELSKYKKDESTKKQEDKKPHVDKKPQEDITYKAPADKGLEEITYKDEEITYSDEEANKDENISDIDFDKLPKEKPKDIKKAPVDREPITYKEPIDNGEITYADIDYVYTDISGAINYKDTMNDIKEFNDNFEITYSDFDIDSNTGALESKKIEKSEAIKAIEDKISELKDKVKKDYEVQQKLYYYLNSDAAKEKYSKEDMRENFAKLEKISVVNKLNRDKIREEIKLLQDKLTGTAYIKDIIDRTSSNMNAVSGQRIRVSEIVQPSKVGKNRLSGMPISEITNNEEILKYKNEAIKIFENMLLDPNDKITNRNIFAKDSLFRGLLFGLKDKNAKGGKVVAEINENVAVALALAADEYYAFMSSKLAYNDKDAIAAMLGLQPHEVSPETQKAFAYEGVFKKLIVDNLGKAVFSNISLAPAGKIVGKNADGSEKVIYEGVDSELYAKMLSDAGQMALIYMEAKGYIEPLVKSSMPITKYKAVTGKNDDADIKEEFKDVSIDEDGKATSIHMVKIKKPMNGKKYSKSEKKANDKLKARVLSDVGIIQSALLLDKNSKGPMFRKPQDLKVNKVKNSKVNKAASESFKVLNKIRQEAYEVNSEAVKLMLELSTRDNTLSIMGFKTEDALEKMAFDDRESAEASNREIEESYDNLIALHEKVAGKDATEANEMYFEYFFGKNGRFYMDSVTVNPQTDKLHRSLVTLKAHRQVMDFNSPDAKKNKQKEYFKVAIAQAFGFAIDKKAPQEIYDFADAVLEQSEETLSGALKNEKHKVEIEKDGKKYEVEIELLGHFFQGLNAIRAYKKAGNGEQPFEVSLSVEFDAITSGFILKLLQLPIMSFEKMKLWLSKGGVFLASTDEEKKALDNITNSGQEISEGRLIDSYRTLASGMKSNIKLSKDIKKHESVWKAMQEVLPKLKDKKTISKAPYSSTKEDEDGESRLVDEVVEIVTSEGRTLFKDPFMTFGYAAAIKSIKRHLGYKMISGLPSMMIDESSKESVEKANKFINSIHGKELTEKELKAFKEKLKNESFEDIKIVAEKEENGRNTIRNVNIAELMRNIIEDTYGSNVETILTAEFGELIEANNRINNSFKIMFQAWKVAYDARAQEISGGKGLTADQENEVLEELKVLFPMIKAPLAGANYMKDGETVAIFSTGLTNAKSGYGPTQTHVNPDKFDGQKTLTVQSMTREFEAAISAGAVIPIHYIDGSAMTKSLEEGGVLGVHDAKVVGINNAQNEIIKYNKDVYEISKDYSLAKEILKSLERVRDNAKKLGVDLDKLEGVYAGKDNPKRTFDEILSEMSELNEVAESGRKLVYGASAKIGHMSGLDGSMYEVKGGKAFEPKNRRRLTIKAPEKKESIKKEVNDSNKAEQREYVNHSGGALGSDTEWEAIGKKYGVKTNAYYTGEKSKLNSPNGNYEISKEDFEEGRYKVAQAAKANWGYQYATMKDPRLIRNWSQVKYADEIFAIGTLITAGNPIDTAGKDSRVAIKTIVSGGTGYAVEMAIQAGKKVYLFDQNKNKWYESTGKSWKPTETPILTKNFAGIGTRNINKNGIKAIEDVYKKTFNFKENEIKAPEKAVSETTNLVMVKDKNGNGIISFKGKGKLSSPSMEVTSYKQLKDIADQYNELIELKNKIQPNYIKYIDEMFETFANKGIAFAPIKIEFKKDKDIEGFGSHSVDKENGRSVLEFASTIDYRGDYPVRIVLHEYAHAITVKALQDNPLLLKKAKELRDHVLAKATDKQKKEFYGLYGDKDGEVYEFIAEAISSPKFQKFLSGIDSISSNQSVLKDIQNLFKSILDFIVKKDEASALTDALEIVLELNGYVAKEDVAENNTTTGALKNNTFEGLIKDAYDKIEVLKDTQKGNVLKILNSVSYNIKGCI